MIQHLLGAALIAGVALHLLSAHGRLKMIRRLRHGVRLHRAVLAGALVLVLANVLCLALPVPPVVAEAIVALTLLALTCTAVIAHRTVLTASRDLESAPRVLVVGAHPDDLELASGGTLAKLADAGHEIHALVMSHGQVGGDSSRRPSEARAGGALLGLAQVEVLDLPDTALAESSQEMVAAIEARLKRLRPQLLITHSAHDLHQDHYAVHLAAMRAGRRQPSILCFESPSTTRDFNPGVFVDITDYLDIKVEAIRCHRDQRGKPYMGAGTVRGTAAFRGSQSRTGFAEGFEVMRLLADAPGILAERSSPGPGHHPLDLPLTLEAARPLSAPDPLDDDSLGSFEQPTAAPLQLTVTGSERNSS